MDRRFLLIAMAILLGALSALGCTPSIGDDCSSSTDCSLRGDRLCDTTQPGGYCTVFNCEPDTCPKEAQCVAFNSSLDPVCKDSFQTPRFQRTFCMFRCEDNSDCRDGYLCLNTTQTNAWGATVVDNAPEGRSICVANSPDRTPGNNGAELCYPYDGGFPDVSYYEPDVVENVDVTPADVSEESLDADGAPEDVEQEPEGSADVADAPIDVSDAPEVGDAPQEAATDAGDAGDAMDAKDASDALQVADASDAAEAEADVIEAADE